MELLRRHELPRLKIHAALKPHLELSPKMPKQTLEKRIKSLMPFADCIGERFERAICICIDVDAFKRTKEHIKRKISGGDDPFYMAFLTLIQNFVTYAGDAYISLVCDDDQDTAKHCLSLYRRFRNEEKSWAKTLKAITFADDEAFPALQAADMLAGLIRREGGQRFLATNNDYLPLLERMTEDSLNTLKTQWRFAWISERIMAKLDLHWDEKL